MKDLLFSIISFQKTAKHLSVYNFVDGIRIKPPKKMTKQKTCGTCHGSGSVYDIYGYRYECSNCGGDGKVWIDF